MIWLNPDSVTLGPHTLDSVTMLALDRGARRQALEWTDLGQHPAFVDVPEQRVDVLIVRRVLQSEASGPRPGELLALVLRASANASAAQVWKVSASVVVLSVTHQLSASGRATQTIRALAVSPTGEEDPITQSLVEGEV